MKVPTMGDSITEVSDNYRSFFLYFNYDFLTRKRQVSYAVELLI